MRLPRVTHGMYPAAGYVVSYVWSRLMSADGVVLPRFHRERVVGLNETASNLVAISDREGVLKSGGGKGVLDDPFFVFDR